MLRLSLLGLTIPKRFSSLTYVQLVGATWFDLANEMWEVMIDIVKAPMLFFRCSPHLLERWPAWVQEWLCGGECPGLLDLDCCWTCTTNKKYTSVVLSPWDFMIATASPSYLNTNTFSKKRVSWNTSNWRSSKELFSVVQYILRKVSPLWDPHCTLAYEGSEKPCKKNCIKFV